MAKLQNRRFFPEDTFLHAKGLHIAVGICRTALVKPWTLKNCELSAGKSEGVGSEISASEVRSQEFKALKPLSKVRGHNFRPIFF